MKALKEKRISLRSLWRRGLVILSLFALVFVSCGDSDSGSNSGGGGGGTVPVKTIREIVSFTGPTATQYFGQPVDLNGVKLTVKYIDGSTDDLTDPKMFSASPNLVTGKYYKDAEGKTAFKGMDGVTVFCNEPGFAASKFMVFGSTQVIGIEMSDTTDFTGPEYITDGQLMWSSNTGLHITGVGDMAKTKYYVDDEDFDPTGLKLEADYLDGKVKKISTDDITWKIIPFYDGPTAANGAYTGYVYLTVGADIEGVMAVGAGDYVGGITVRAPLEEVYTPLKVVDGGLSFASDKPIEDYFFWMTNTSSAWANRLSAAGGKLTVNYTGGQEPKTFPIGDLLKKEKIWYNANPEVGGVWYEEFDPELIRTDFYVRPLATPFAKPNMSPAIAIYYRGSRFLNLPVDVYTKLMSVKANAEPVEYDTTGSGRDNDIDYGEIESEKLLSGLLEIYGVYQAYNNSEKILDKKLAYQATPTYDGAYYTITDYQSVLASVKPGATKKVTVSHRVNGIPVTGIGQQGAKTAKPDVIWIK